MQQLIGRLQVGSIHDPFEIEADRAASRALARPPGNAPRAPTTHELHRTSSPRQTDGAAPDSVEHTLARPGVPLDPSVQQEMKGRFGHDFSAVRVHTGKLAEQSAWELAAQAYTVGQHVVFGAGAYAPQTAAGRSLLAHELAHTLQQGRPWVQRVPMPSQPNASEPTVLINIKETLARKNLPFSTEVKVRVSNVKGVKGSVELTFDVVYQGDRLYALEAKGAAPDKLTEPQRIAHRALQEHGGTVVVVSAGGKPPGGARVHGIPVLTKGYTWQIKPGEMQHVHGRHSGFHKPQAASQPNTMVVTAWKEGMDARYADSKPRKPGDINVIKPNEKPEYKPQSARHDPSVTPQHKPKPTTPQRFIHPTKPPSPTRAGSFDHDEGSRLPGLRGEQSRWRGGNKPFFRKLEQTKPIPTFPPPSTGGNELAAAQPKPDQANPVAVKPPIKTAPPQVDADAAAPASRNAAPGTGWNIAGHGAALGVDLLAAWVHNENTKSRIEKLTQAKLRELQPEFDQLATQRPKEIHAVVTLSLTVVTSYSGRPWGVEESVGPPMVRLEDMHLATAGVATAEEMENPSFSVLGSNKSETTRLTYSFLLRDLEAESKRQARQLQDRQRQDKLEALNKALEQSQKAQAKPKPKAKAASRGAAALAPSMAEPASLLPWPTQSGGRADQKKETKGAWTIGLQIRDEAIALRNESTAHQRKVFALKVALYRDQVQIMIRDFSDHEMTQSLMKLLYQFDEVMRQRFVEIGIANYPE